MQISEIIILQLFKNVVDGSMKFELANDKKTTLIFYDEIEDTLNFDIVSGNVTIYMTQDMTLTNRGLKRSAVDVHSGATLNLYVLENVKLTVDSGYGEDANGNVPGKGGYAGIHVPEGATLNLYGKGTIEAFGGIAGTGGTIRASNNANIYSYNGNLYTDGTSYNNGLNQCPIYLQAGIVTAKYTYNINYGGSQSYLLFELQLKSASSTSTKSGYKNMKYNDTNVSNRYITKNVVLTNIDMLEQGVGSGAGYIEVSNGTYIIDANMN